MDSPKPHMSMEVDYENKNYTSYNTNKMDTDFIPYNTNFNFDILNCEKDIKCEDNLYNGAFMWNFEDYFSI